MFTSHLSRLLPSVTRSTISHPPKVGTMNARSFSTNFRKQFPVADKAWESYRELEKHLKQNLSKDALLTNAVATGVRDRFVVVVGASSDNEEKTLVKKLLPNAQEGKYAVVARDIEEHGRTTSLTTNLNNPDLTNLIEFVRSHSLLHHPLVSLMHEERARLLKQVSIRPKETIELLNRVYASWVGTGLSRSHFDLIAAIKKLAGQELLAQVPTSVPSKFPAEEWINLFYGVTEELTNQSTLPIELKGLTKAVLKKPTDWKLHSEFQELMDGNYQTAVMLENLRQWAEKVPADKVTAVIIDRERLPKFLGGIQMLAQ